VTNIPQPATPDETLQWTLPDGWTELPAQQMRFAAFSVTPDDPGIVLTVIPLGLESKDTLANVNRWQQQLGLPPTPQDQLDSVVSHLHVKDLHVDVVDLASPVAADGKPRQRTLAAIIPRENKVWFLKLTGPASVLEQQKARFDAFVQSLEFTSLSGSMPSALQTSPADGAAKLSWTTPQGWRQDTQPRPMRAVTFFMGPENDPAELIVTRLPVDGSGTYIDNVNRWRGQLGLEPLADASGVQQVQSPVGDGSGVRIEFTSADSARRMLVVMASDGNDMWFFKLTGPVPLVSDLADEFEAFLKSVEFEH
jgi:hypothetical protein